MPEKLKHGTKFSVDQVVCDQIIICLILVWGAVPPKRHNSEAICELLLMSQNVSYRSDSFYSQNDRRFE